ncbi:alpha/beta fold hydrolase [Paracidovorax sp. MALMAid1276]|uniref:alpha/beta fold hydrolase n=1 Tax=Paracidovorax sp. MALMAid1276 TaxID=3411631 RepID=UPI003B9B67BA
MPPVPRPPSLHHSRRHWILLRGLTREGAHWGDFAQRLQQALPGDTVRTLDLPGNGAQHRMPSATTVQDMVHACRNALGLAGSTRTASVGATHQAEDCTPPPQRYHLLAMSLGAMVATEWAHSAPHEVAGCVLINTSMRPFSPVHQRLRLRNLPALLRLAWHWRSDAAAAEAIILRLTSQRAEEHRARLADWVDVRRQRPVAAANALRQLLAAARYRAPAQVPAPPVLLLGSQHDGLVSSQCSVALARAWGCSLRLHPFAGHDLPLDDPQWVIDGVCDWLENDAGKG